MSGSPCKRLLLRPTTAARQVRLCHCVVQLDHFYPKATQGYPFYSGVFVAVQNCCVVFSRCVAFFVVVTRVWRPPFLMFTLSGTGGTSNASRCGSVKWWDTPHETLVLGHENVDFEATKCGNKSGFAWQARYFCQVFRRRVTCFVADAAL